MILMKNEVVILKMRFITIMKCQEEWKIMLENIVAKNVMIKTKLFVDEATKSEGEDRGVMTLKKQKKVTNEEQTHWENGKIFIEEKQKQKIMTNKLLLFCCLRRGHHQCCCLVVEMRVSGVQKKHYSKICPYKLWMDTVSKNRYS